MSTVVRYGLPIVVVASLCAITACSIVMLVQYSVGNRLGRQLDLSCVVGRSHEITEIYHNASFPSYLVSRDDAGILYAKWILGDGATDQAASDLIRSQTTTLGNWTARVTHNQLQVDPRIAGFPLWEYPVDVPDDQRGGRSSIAVAGRLPTGLEGHDAFIYDTQFPSPGMKYCDSDGARGNVWHELRGMLPDALLVLGLSGLLSWFLVVLAIKLFEHVITSRVQPCGSCACDTTQLIYAALVYAMVNMCAGTYCLNKPLGNWTTGTWEYELVQSPQTLPAFSACSMFLFSVYLLPAGMSLVVWLRLRHGTVWVQCTLPCSIRMAPRGPVEERNWSQDQHQREQLLEMIRRGRQEGGQGEPTPGRADEARPPEAGASTRPLPPSLAVPT